MNDEKDRISERLRFAAKVAEYILTENLQTGGYDVNMLNIAQQSEKIAEDILLYCGANEGIDFFNDDDVIKSAVSLMSEGKITCASEETENLKNKILNIHNNKS